MVNNSLFIIPIVVAIIAVALGVAYQTEALNPIFEKIGVYYFKAEAKAEEKKMEAQGLKEGEDFLKGKWCHRFFCCIDYSWMKRGEDERRCAGFIALRYMLTCVSCRGDQWQPKGQHAQ
jgi:hypothetical protein